MNLRSKIQAIACAAIVGMVLAPSAPNPANVGNGWYANLPPVTESQLQPIIACLTQAGLPAGPVLRSEKVYGGPNAGPNDPTDTPSVLRYDVRGGKDTGAGVGKHDADAVFTYYAPAVTYTEVWRADHNGQWPTHEQRNALQDCANAVKSPLVITTMKFPLGIKQAATWCQEKMQVNDCWQGNQDDQFLPGGEFRDSGGAYRKVKGGWFFLTWSAWRKV